MKNHSGFSLVEMVFVIAIVGVVGTMATVGVKSFLDSGRIQVAIDNMEAINNAVQKDITAIMDDLEPSRLAKGESTPNTDSSCETIAINIVKNVNSKFKNAFYASGLMVANDPNFNPVSAYGNAMVSGDNEEGTWIVYSKYQGTGYDGTGASEKNLIFRGSVIVSCGNPTSKVSDEDFLIYSCVCRTPKGIGDTCSFDNSQVGIGDGCPIPVPTSSSISNPYSPVINNP